MILFSLTNTLAQESTPRLLPIEEFIRLATQNDTEFQSILIDEMALKYEKKLRLPPGDLVLEAQQNFNFYLQEDRDEPESIVSLSKLFPKIGTEIEAGYGVSTPRTSTLENSEASIFLTQPIARNAFGRSTRLLDKIVGVEIDVARHQIAEAYEDYMAEILAAYHDWNEAYENLLIGRSSYKENLKLLENIKERQKSRIALSIDVNKITLQVLAKKESLVDLEESYKSRLHVIERIIRADNDEELVPQNPDPYAPPREEFDDLYQGFRTDSRTYRILDLLENRSRLVVKREADDLFPSINLRAGYEIEGDGSNFDNEEETAIAGVTFEWPIPDTVNRAEKNVAKIVDDKTKLETQNTHYRLYTAIRNLYVQIRREQELIAIADDKIRLARAVVRDETENYSFGKVSLNDFISAVNVLDSNRFNKIRHDALYRKLIIEWRRLTDSLIGIGVKSLHPTFHE